MEFIHNWVVPQDALAPAWAYCLAALGALLCISVSKGGFGVGAGALSVPLLLQVAKLPFVVGLWLPVLLACDVATIRCYPQQWSPRSIRKLAPWTLLGVLAAAGLLFLLSHLVDEAATKRLAAALNLTVAVLAIGFVVLAVWPRPSPARAAWRPGCPMSALLGVLTGVSSTLAHAAGPLVLMYLLPQKLETNCFVGTLARFFLCLNALKVPFLVAAGVLTLTTLRYGIWLMLLAPFGVWLGAWLTRSLSPIWFLRLVHIFMVVVALKLGYDALRSFAG
jgi:hypothetical protein